MEVNELAQWVVLVFMGVFLLGLTRQLGAFMRPHSEELADMGPALGTEVPSALVDDPTRRRLSALIRGKSSWHRAAALVIDEQCSGCRSILDDLVSGIRPPDVVLVAILKDSTSEIFRSTVASVADVVIADPHSTGCGAAGIYGTPMVMLLDERLRVVQKDFGGDLLTRVSEWISEMETEAEQLSA